MEITGNPVADDLLRHLAPGTCVRLWLRNRKVLLGMVDHVEDSRNELVVAWPDIQPRPRRKADPDSLTIRFADIAAMRRFPNPTAAVLETRLAAMPPGTHLAIRGYHHDAHRVTVERGRLCAIDWDARTLVLHDLTYDLDVTVHFDQMLSIEGSPTESTGLRRA
ncbi:hypothetical protein KR767_10190 [Luteibacter anthropi]|uniref:hypothetical protein n=1 Tax=Luteibacter anthropi TaxID=564369 RepID=UPI002032FCA1|nr:hypothetical protein [Luteibacter anthropi]URX64382.1 hypothetical protein KR767_10190 [Luteibacter anthropi]